MTPLVERLRQLAKKATPGPWINDAPGCVAKYWDEGGKSTICLSTRSSIADDFPFIASANPQTVLKLLDAIEEMRGALEQYKGMAGYESPLTVSQYSAASESLARIEEILK